MNAQRAVPTAGDTPVRSFRLGHLALALALTVAGAPAPVGAQGLSTYRAQMWDQDLLQVPDEAEMDDELGHAVSAGDFNGDGFDDLAIGVPREDILTGGEEISSAGTVLVLHGSSAGLALSAAQFWHQDTPGVVGAIERGEIFGFSLASGNFNGDAYDDLAIGVPREEAVGLGAAGGVNVLYGSATGLTATGDQLWSQGEPGIPSDPGVNEAFGYSVAAGDFDNDGYGDLAIGVPMDFFYACDYCGAVHVLFGSVVGLTVDGDQYLQAPDFGGSYESDSGFGISLAAGDFDADGFADLAIGAPDDDFVGVVNVGSVRVLFGSDLGLTTDRDIYILGAEQDGRQGNAVGAGDLDGDGDDDLAIGIPGRTVGGDAAAGAVAILLGDGGQFLDGGEWSQDTAGVQGVAEPDDGFGGGLAFGDFDRDGRADLVVSVMTEDLQEPDEGAVHVLFGSESGVTATGDQLWLRDDLPLPDPSPGDGDDYFGSALAVGDFDGSGHADLAIGSRGEALTTADAAGAVYVLHGFLFADGFESGGTAAWSSTAP